MNKDFIVFLDDGGVMNDNTLRGPQWQKYLGECLPSHLGGTAEAWAEANRLVITADFFDTFLLQTFGRVDVSFQDYEKAYAKIWFEKMCSYVGVQPPAPTDCVVLLREVTRYVTARVRASYVGVIETIKALHEEGYTLHTASNESSYELEGYLSGMGVRQCFDRLYGVDVVDILKESPEYYRRVFKDAGVEASQAVFVDDSARRLAYAAQLGARTILVGRTQDVHFDAMISRLRDLPEFLKRL